MAEPLAEIAAALEAADALPYDHATAMPGSYYVDGALLALEREHLFGKEWLCVGRADEIPEPGDFLTCDLMGEPLAIVRGTDGQLRALSNVCRHRGVPILAGNGRTRRLVCPYHAWTYDLTGQLIGAPEMSGRARFDREGCRLPEFPCETWMGFVFVSFDPDAAPLAPRLAGLNPLIRNYHFEEMKTRHVAWEVWDTNWKSLVENFMEGYHLSPLHRETLHPVNPTRLCKHFPPGEKYFGYTVGFDPEMQRDPLGHPDLSKQERDTCVMIAVPPNLLIGGASDYSSFLCIEPLGVDRVRVRLGLFFYGDGWSDADIDTAVVLFNDTMAEDKIVLDRINRGLRSAHYTPGPLASEDFEGSVVDLARYVGARLRGVPGITLAQLT